MIDIHSHIIPSIDDGAKDLDYSLKMIKIAEKSGTKKIVATPHYYIGRYEEKYFNIKKNLEHLNEIAKKDNMNIEIFLGQEVLIHKKTIELYERGDIGTINSTSYMLVEFPMATWEDYYMDILYELKVRGINPIIAHPERYKFIHEDIFNINKLIEEGYLVQINTGSIEGIFGKDVQKISKEFMKNRICNFIGSDAHSLDVRKPDMNKGIKIIKTMDRSLYDEIIENSNNLLENKEIITSYSKIERKKGIFSFLKNMI
ncbi:exopolysaccharide biosynthesis protein [Clostridium botulinum]|uniref:protein-tyrosine-phosphatase n=1 Tax=Clostridium botulinum TaxID=1491 RepID=A0A846J4V5_CLOBO|nr:CpsB/CapC family capsule biosynthesis tyrosine phosphatase [Clostridium botulinum]ACA56915.1 exopolysaccharide biosynthesis protein [Clostridium botulinum A3 str. Loch Maree]NFH66505.1 exopolysaccharide biosynthesis protein [Clostridium botulinum]NFJ09116.1 exopolysaccharide biosynthesis protein [Clostridium botulinum]NFK13658.1 exopolysaccharide biosynthesis protein [Clostridium botulinum]NFM95226.1 exopolysaccharide biosynthesis protein [Clostridium botulinum]